MKKKVLKIVIPISILLISAIITLCIILFQKKNPYQLQTENFETTIEFNGDVDLNSLTNIAFSSALSILTQKQRKQYPQVNLQL